MSIPAASHKLCEHEGCNRGDYGMCVWSCPRPGCREFPSIHTPGVVGSYTCWSCGKWLMTFSAQGSEADIDNPAGRA